MTALSKLTDEDGVDGPFEKMMGPKPKRTRKAKPFDAAAEKERLFDEWSAHRKRHGCAGWSFPGCPIDGALLNGACELVRAEYMVALFAWIREVCQ